MIETWRAMLNKGQYVAAVIMDLVKAFDMLNQKLLRKKYKATVSMKNHFIMLKAILLIKNKGLS